MSQLVALNNKLNLLSPDLVHGDEERAEVQQQRENLYAEIKHHRAKGHEGKPCPAARQTYAETGPIRQHFRSSLAPYHAREL